MTAASRRIIPLYHGSITAKMYKQSAQRRSLQGQARPGLENNLKCMICKGPTDTLVRLADEDLLQKMIRVLMREKEVQCPTNDMQVIHCGTLQLVATLMHHQHMSTCLTTCFAVPGLQLLLTNGVLLGCRQQHTWASTAPGLLIVHNLWIQLYVRISYQASSMT